LRNVLQTAVFESSPKRKNSPYESQQKKGRTGEVPEDEEDEGYISIEQMATMIEHYQSYSNKDGTTNTKVNMLSVISVLNYFLNILQSNFIDVAIVRQFFEHTFSYIDSFLFDVLLLRKDLCSRKKGYEIRANLRKLERWSEETGAEWVGNAGACLSHIQQATGVLLMSNLEKRKICTDPPTRLAKCSSLNVFQIRLLLSMYTPDEGEDKIPLELMVRLYESSNETAALGNGQKRQASADNGSLLLDSAVVGILNIGIMHYVECKDVLALPLPQTIKTSLQAHEKEKEEELRKLQQRDDDKKKKRRSQPAHRKSMVFW